MVTRAFSGRDVVKALTKHRYGIVDRTGSHVKLRYEHPDPTVGPRIVAVPLHDRIKIGTLRSIADQCGAVDFERWCRCLDENR